jgi:Spo0E like sporulation regulatory protein
MMFLPFPLLARPMGHFALIFIHLRTGGESNWKKYGIIHFEGDVIMIYLKLMIEIQRQRMFDAAKQYGIVSEQTISCSQHLDDLLNILMRVEHYKRTNKVC